MDCLPCAWAAWSVSLSRVVLGCMHTITLRLVTIVTEQILEDRLLHALEALGAKGYALMRATGKGSRGVRATEWEDPDTGVETLVSPTAADAIVAHAAEKHFEHCAVILFKTWKACAEISTSERLQ